MPKEIHSKSILNKSKRRDPWFLDDYTLNPYSGCSFNCLYCYIRGSKYGEHMERSMSAKVNAPELPGKYQKFFDQSNEMPAYYRSAFYKKMAELGAKYKISNRII